MSAATKTTPADSTEKPATATGAATTEEILAHRTRTAEPDPMDDESDEMSDSSDEDQTANHRPKVNSFTQQQLRAVHPIFTPKTIIPLLLVLAVIFVPIGVAMYLGQNKVREFVIEYTDCESLANSDTWTELPSSAYDYRFHKDISIKPVWKLATNSSSVFADYADEQTICKLQFQVPESIGPHVYMYYRLKDFYPNHRRYATSFSEDQIRGEEASEHDIKDTVGQNCQPLSIDDATGKIIYPCGLIANSMFNDTFTILKAANDTSDDYMLYRENIAWKYGKSRFKKTSYSPDDVVPPPNWAKMYPDGYTEDNMPDISEWPEFQNWLAPSALSKFSKLISKNDDDVLSSGTYEVDIGLHWPVDDFNGHKYLYLTTKTLTGGKNPFLGICWIVAGGICVVLAILFVVLNIVSPRKLGDPTLLSWNEEKQSAAADQAAARAANAAANTSGTPPKSAGSSSS